MKFKKKLLLILKLNILLLNFKLYNIFIYKYGNISYVKKNLIENSINIKSNTIRVENREYYNRSLGFNYLDMCQKEHLLKFNRKTPDFNSNILFVLILLYPDPFNILKLRLSSYIDIISKEVDFNFSIAVITCNNDISKLMIRKSSQLNVKYISKFTLKNIEIPNSECFSFVTHSNYKIIDIFYTNTKYSKFSYEFLNNYHFTSVSNHSFKGYYAAGTNFYAYVPSHLGLFDFFDYFIKFDHDQIKKLEKKLDIEPFPLKKMITENKYFFFSCRLRHDAGYVSTNLYKTFLMFILKYKDKCNYTVLPVNLYKYKETISEVGAVNICWLGFYSMLVIRLFSEEYLSVPYGLYKNRWGDQQFFIPTLFGFNFKNFSYFNKNIYLCSWIGRKKKNKKV